MQTILGVRIFRIEPSQRAFQPETGENSRGTVSRTHDKKHVEVKILDHIVQMRVDQNQPRTCSPMTLRSVSENSRAQQLYSVKTYPVNEALYLHASSLVSTAHYPAKRSSLSTVSHVCHYIGAILSLPAAIYAAALRNLIKASHAGWSSVVF